MKPEHNTKRKLRIEFIKSGAMLLLAIVLLISAVFAWFGSPEDPRIEPFEIGIRTEVGAPELGSSVVTEKTVILPCATKPYDDSISDVDLSKAIKVIPLEVESATSNDVRITIETVPGLHFYIDPNYNADDSALLYAQTILDNYESGIGNDLSQTMSYDADNEYDEVDKLYRHWVAVIYWADYDALPEGESRTVGQIIEAEGEIGLNSTMSFKVIREDGE